MSVSELSSSTQNYVKVIWGLSEWSDEPVTASMIAAKMGLRMSTVSGAVSKLAEQGLVDHARYGAVTLTDAGSTHAVEMVRRHRLIETFLVSVLGYTWDQVHDEAENLEHAVSDFMIERIDAFLDHPTRDPHGDPIPTTAGDVALPAAFLLSDARPGCRVVVERISDADSELLGFFADHGIIVGARMEVGDSAPYSEAMTVTVGKGPELSLGRFATDAVRVSSAESSSALRGPRD